MKVGCYTLDLYCDKDTGKVRDPIHTYGDSPHNFTGQTLAECVRTARAAGWLVGKTQDLCPKCSGKRRKAEEE